MIHKIKLKQYIAYTNIFLAMTVLISCKDIAGNIINKGSTGVVVADKAVVRLEPMIFSSVICNLERGQKVKIVQQSLQKCWVGSMENFWYKINISNGISGWIYGSNIKIFSEDDSGLDDFVSDLWESESHDLAKNLSGKWWSVDKQGNYTNYFIELGEDNKYKTYEKKSEEKSEENTEQELVEGDYNISIKEKQIILLNGAKFGDKMYYKLRGRSYILRTGNDIEFARITVDTAERTESEKANESKNK